MRTEMIPPTRLRNAAATRQAILDSARRHFAREGYDNVGLREIAGDAGVDPALVCRYFGGKEHLLKEAARGDTPPLFEGLAGADLRAGLCLAVLIGVGMLRSAFAAAPPCGAAEGELRRALERLFEAALS